MWELIHMLTYLLTLCHLHNFHKQIIWNLSAFFFILITLFSLYLREIICFYRIAAPFSRDWCDWLFTLVSFEMEMVCRALSLKIWISKIVFRKALTLINKICFRNTNTMKWLFVNKEFLTLFFIPKLCFKKML